MAEKCIRYRDKANTNLMEFVCDSISDLDNLPTTIKKGTGIFKSFDQYAPIGSTCVVGNEGGDLLVYMLFSFGWKQL